jgi:electron transfer flavoprotein beta subunit
MHILVPVKRVIDHNVKVRVMRDGSGVETNNVKMSLNPFDEVAIEQALRLREQGLASKVTVVTCGPAAAQDVLRTALALGADAALLVEVAAPLDSLAVARTLHALVMREQVGLVICGKQAIDDDLGATGPMLAALLDWPQATSVSAVTLAGELLEVVCDGDRGMEQFAIDRPAVLCVDLRLCDPRTVTLPALMRAKKAAIATIALADLLALPGSASELVAVAEPPARQPGVMLPDLDALLARLRPLLASPST